MALHSDICMAYSLPTGLGSDVIFPMRPIITTPFKSGFCSLSLLMLVCCSNGSFLHSTHGFLHTVSFVYTLCVLFIISPYIPHQGGPLHRSRDLCFLLGADTFKMPRTVFHTSSWSTNTVAPINRLNIASTSSLTLNSKY